MASPGFPVCTTLKDDTLQSRTCRCRVARGGNHASPVVVWGETSPFNAPRPLPHSKGWGAKPNRVAVGAGPRHAKTGRLC